MAKAIICVGSTQVVGDSAMISYTVSVIGPPSYSYGSDYTVNPQISSAANLLAWRNRIIAQVAERKITLAVADVIVFGGPS